MAEPLILRAGAATDVGRRRARNEDSLLAAFPVFVVADGMGGHDVGDRASQAVIAAFDALVGREQLETADVVTAIDGAQATVRQIAAAQPNGAGSTLTGVVVVEQAGRPHWLVVNVGDSRVYRSRDGRLEQLTVDHSIAQQLIDDGQLARGDVATFTKRNVITKAVGADDSDADYWVYPIVTGEILLACSDGLTGEISDDTIARILASTPEPREQADRLLRAALDAGGRDNISVVVVQVVSGGISGALDEATGVVRSTLPPEHDTETTLEMPRRMPRG